MSVKLSVCVYSYKYTLYNLTFVTFPAFLTVISCFQFLTNTECFSDYFPKSSILTWAYNESEGFDLINIGDGLNVVK